MVYKEHYRNFVISMCKHYIALLHKLIYNIHKLSQF